MCMKQNPNVWQILPSGPMAGIWLLVNELTSGYWGRYNVVKYMHVALTLLRENWFIFLCNFNVWNASQRKKKKVRKKMLIG